MEYIRIQFKFNFPAFKLSNFRGAINELLQQNEALFHNHDNKSKDKKYNFNYPLIKYTTYRGKACIIGIAAGAEALLLTLLPKLTKLSVLTIANKPYDISNFVVEKKEINIGFSNYLQPFTLNHWIALNGDNYKYWKQYKNNSTGRQLILNSALTGHIRRLTNNLAPKIPKELVEANVLEIKDIKKVNWHKTQLITFSVIAESNIIIPEGLSIGRISAFGFGQVIATNKNDFLAKRFEEKRPRVKSSLT